MSRPGTCYFLKRSLPVTAGEELPSLWSRRCGNENATCWFVVSESVPGCSGFDHLIEFLFSGRESHCSDYTISEMLRRNNFLKLMGGVIRCSWFSQFRHWYDHICYNYAYYLPIGRIRKNHRPVCCSCSVVVRKTLCNWDKLHCTSNPKGPTKKQRAAEGISRNFNYFRWISTDSGLRCFELDRCSRAPDGTWNSRSWGFLVISFEKSKSQMVLALNVIVELRIAPNHIRASHQCNYPSL